MVFSLALKRASVLTATTAHEKLRYSAVAPSPPSYVETLRQAHRRYARLAMGGHVRPVGALSPRPRADAGEQRVAERFYRRSGSLEQAAGGKRTRVALAIGRMARAAAMRHCPLSSSPVSLA